MNMNIEMLSPDKLRVVLTTADLNRYELSYTSISSDSPATKRMVTDILTQARTTTGFLFKDAKLLIEVVPGRNQGCVLYLTKTPVKHTPHRSAPMAADPGSAHAYILSCDCLDDLLDAVGRFARFPDIALHRSSIYGLNGGYCLLFAPVMPGLDRRRLGSLMTELSEYGTTGPADEVREALLAEHGSPISPEYAVENVMRYFS